MDSRPPNPSPGLHAPRELGAASSRGLPYKTTYPTLRPAPIQPALQNQPTLQDDLPYAKRPSLPSLRYRLGSWGLTSTTDLLSVNQYTRSLRATSQVSGFERRVNHASYECKGCVCPDLPYKTAYPILRPTGRNEAALHDLAYNTRAYPTEPPTPQNENAPYTPDVPNHASLPYTCA